MQRRGPSSNTPSTHVHITHCSPGVSSWRMVPPARCTRRLMASLRPAPGAWWALRCCSSAQPAGEALDLCSSRFYVRTYLQQHSLLLLEILSLSSTSTWLAWLTRSTSACSLVAGAVFSVGQSGLQTTTHTSESVAAQTLQTWQDQIATFAAISQEVAALKAENLDLADVEKTEQNTCLNSALAELTTKLEGVLKRKHTHTLLPHCWRADRSCHRHPCRRESAQPRSDWC